MMFGREKAAVTKGERGATIIEFALISTLMFTLMFAILSYGEVLADYVQLRYRAGEVARLVSLGEDGADREQIYLDAQNDTLRGFMNMTGCAGALTYSALSTTPIVDGEDPPVEVGSQISFTLSYDFDHGGDGNCRIMPQVFVPLPGNVSATRSFTISQ
ncbi:pilus assembly protein [Zavarzinia compransoris]|uniref:TadE/TadG family type IV pilus assembly protein n=1 Tax=Zavarzinia marina TaxID=2911065 RepID=UPI001F2F523A|nr:TadE family protein [Zavarzinia marina]MCF4166428.1 pilus assembly protein [Zavarzinia marina]